MPPSDLPHPTTTRTRDVALPTPPGFALRSEAGSRHSVGTGAGAAEERPGLSSAFTRLVAAVAGYGILCGPLFLFVPPLDVLGAAAAIGYGVLVLATALRVVRSPGSRAGRVLLGAVLALCIPLYYWMTGRAIEHLALPLWDDALHHVDALLLGWLVPDGQIAVWIDRSDLLGPHTTLGRVLTEVLQIAYASFFLWGYGLLAILLARVARGAPATAWTSARQFMCAWLGTYVLIYACYLLVPAVGPWVVRSQDYVHPLSGLLLAAPVRDFLGSQQATGDCFPSGHTALSWITAYYALRFAPRWGRAAVVAAALITVSTIVLRYHYLIDVLVAVPVVWVGIAFGGRAKRPVPASPPPSPA